MWSTVSINRKAAKSFVPKMIIDTKPAKSIVIDKYC